jgi:peptidoglycan/xylan/chitin deacetylase (PgdA/CDA1 family)
MWEVLSGDFDRGLSGRDCVKALLRYSRPGSILLFHDSEKAKERVLEALPKVLEHFQGKGFSFPLIPGSRDGIGVDPLLQDPQ